MQRSWAASLLFATLLASATTVASAKPVVDLHLSGALVEKGDNGSEKLTPVEKAQLKSGDTIRYEISAGNTGTDPAYKLIPVGRIPAGTAYEAGTAHGPASRVEFSLDGGKSWAAVPMIKVQTPSGVVERRADPSAYTAVRWVGEKPLRPHASLTYSYRVRVK